MNYKLGININQRKPENICGRKKNPEGIICEIYGERISGRKK